MKMHQGILSAAILLALTSLVGASAVAAEAAQDSNQGGTQAVVPGKKPAKQLQTVNVTATHATRSLQKVPIAMSAITQDQLKSANITQLSDIQYLAPGISFSSTATAANGGGFQVRGIGSQAYGLGMDQTVGMVVDDVVVSLPRDPGASGFNDIQDVEVLRGPQGTLFGKNASAGVVAIKTKDPVIGENSGDLHIAYGSRNEHIEQGVGNVTLSDTMALRVSIYDQGQSGAIPNVSHNWNAGDNHSSGIRGKLLWKPIDKLAVTFAAERQSLFSRDPYILKSLGTDPNYNALFKNYPNVGGNHFVSYADSDWFASQFINGFSTKAEYQLNDETTLTSITAYRSLKMTQQADLDQSPANILDNSDSSMRAHQFTQEFRVAGKAFSDRLDYVSGVFLDKSNLTSDYLVYGHILPPYNQPYYYNLTGGEQHAHLTTKSLAWYGNSTYSLTDKLSLLLGARYTHDQVSVQDSPTYPAILDGLPVRLAAARLVPSQGRVSKGNVSGKAGLQYQFTPDVMAYLSASTGYKGPTANINTTNTNTIAPETSVAYELGFKSKFFNRRLMVNADAFWDTFHNFQAQAYDTQSFSYLLTNAGAMRTRGVEGEATWVATDNLTLGANGAFTDAKYLSYITACPVPGSIPCYTAAGGSRQANFAGQTPAFVSKYTATLHATYIRPITDGLLFDADGGVSWRSSFYNVIGQDQTKTPSYAMINGSLGISSSDDKWRVGLYVRNLANKHFSSLLIYSATINPNGVFQHLTPDAFRTVGVSFDWKF